MGGEREGLGSELCEPRRKMVKFVLQKDKPDGWVGNRSEGRRGIKAAEMAKAEGRLNSKAAGIQV